MTFMFQRPSWAAMMIFGVLCGGCASSALRAFTPTAASSQLTDYMDPEFPGAPQYWHLVEAALQDATRADDQNAMVVGWARMHWADAGMYVLAATNHGIEWREWGGLSDPTSWETRSSDDPGVRRCYEELYTLARSMRVREDSTRSDTWPRVVWLWLPREGKLWRFNRTITGPRLIDTHDVEANAQIAEWARIDAAETLLADWGSGAAVVEMTDILAESIRVTEDWIETEQTE